MARIPGSGIVRGMALTLTRFFQPKVTVRYPEVKADIPPRNRGRLELVTDERVWNGVWVMTLFSGLSLALEIGLGLAIALYFNRDFREFRELQDVMEMEYLQMVAEEAALEVIGYPSTDEDQDGPP